MTIIDTENMQIVNGLVLDFESSLYICKFLARMVYNYTKTSQFFKENIFRSVLTTTVRQFVEQDVLKHGCLLELKDALTQLTES